MQHLILPAAVALLSLFSLPTAQAEAIKTGIEIRNGNNSNGIKPLTPKGMLTIGGISGGNRADPGARNCYGSTRCKESGSYYSEQGVMHYKNGQPLVQRNATRRVGSTTQGTAGSTINSSSGHNQWCSNQYRSYRASDNSYQPFTGGRQSCNSPF